jgi:hypothetical protein
MHQCFTRIRQLLNRTTPMRVVTLTVVALTACGGEKSAPTPASTPAQVNAMAAPKVVAFDNPADSGSAQPGVTISSSGNVYLSWQDRLPDSSLVLRYAVRANDKWSDVHDVKTGKNMLASAGDVPTVHEMPSGELVAVWRGSHDKTGYDIVMAHSTDKGATWSAPVMPHRDATNMEHGFVSWLQLGDTSAMIWVDGRGNTNPDKAKRATQLTLATLDSRGNPQKERVIDTKICDCCHTSSVAVPGGAVVVYRDRKEGEIRDINAIRVVGSTWREPVAVHNDDWHIDGCPVNGPSISARGEKLAVAWFTAAHDSARVRVAFSSDTANSFGNPVNVNEGFPDGHVGIAMLNDTSAVASWIERKGAVAVLRLRTITASGKMSSIADVAELGEGKRAGGQPKLLLVNDHALLTYTDPKSSRVVTARVELP